MASFPWKRESMRVPRVNRSPCQATPLHTSWNNLNQIFTITPHRVNCVLAFFCPYYKRWLVRPRKFGPKLAVARRFAAPDSSEVRSVGSFGARALLEYTTLVARWTLQFWDLRFVNTCVLQERRWRDFVVVCGGAGAALARSGGPLDWTVLPKNKIVAKFYLNYSKMCVKVWPKNPGYESSNSKQARPGYNKRSIIKSYNSCVIYWSASCHTAVPAFLPSKHRRIV